ncbi:PAS domain-containing protein [Mesoterricola sediminis]|uniref:histidine kinase n=1 Tax=Mesoterricola sediminis TaxID=2927980 RepID=A0AA48GXT6_9BACT|nr:PAS domain-containing protein [Mesoterricola sediminis]BDU77590.1 hypothetical protein METESE_25480 [Mesoterricola sediminis]
MTPDPPQSADPAPEPAPPARRPEGGQALGPILDTIPQAVFWKDPEGRYQGCNRVFASYVGLDEAALVGRTDRELPWPPEHAEAYMADDREVLEGRVPWRRRVEPVRRVDGSTRWVETTKVPLAGAEGRPAGILGIFEDVTERLRLEAELRDVQELNESIIRSAEEGIVVTDPGLRVRVWNAYMAAMTGLPEACILGRPLLDALPRLEDVGFRDRIRRVLGGEAVAPLEFPWHVDASGTSGWAVDRSVALRDGSGAIVGALSLMRDITARRTAEKALRESESRFRALFESLTEGVALHELARDAGGRSVDYRILDVNPAFERHTGLARQAVRGRLASDVYGGPVAPFLETYARVADGGVPASFEVRFEPMAKDFRVTAVSPKPGQFATVFEDITERLARERDLARLNALYGVLSHLGRCLVRVATREELFQDACRILVESGGYRVAWVLWQDAAGVFLEPLAGYGEAVAAIREVTVRLGPDASGALGPTATAIRNGRVEVCRDFHEDPRTGPWREPARSLGLRSFAVVPLREGSGEAGALLLFGGEPKDFHPEEVGLLEEVGATLSFGLDHLAADAERVRLASQVAQAQKMDSLGSLAGGVAHDINNVLGAVQALAMVHQLQAPEGSRVRRDMETVIRACQRGGNLVKGLLGFARQNLAENRLLDLNGLVREEAALLERTTLGRVRLVLDLAPEPLVVNGDPGALAHCLMNLCVNAVDAMPGGGTLALSTRREGERVRLEVADTGTGMPPEVLEKALDPFYTTKPQGKGTGLGLAIVYGTVKNHRGDLELASAPGEGTRVRIRLPLAGTAAPAPGPRAAEAGGPARARSILLVDDDELILSSIPALVESLGHRVETASSGAEGLARLARGPVPDLVILDMNMPDLDGGATLARIRRDHPTLPVLLATGRADQTALDLVAAHPYVTLLPKPFNLQELGQAIEGYA